MDVCVQQPQKDELPHQLRQPPNDNTKSQQALPKHTSSKPTAKCRTADTKINGYHPTSNPPKPTEPSNDHNDAADKREVQRKKKSNKKRFEVSVADDTKKSHQCNKLQRAKTQNVLILRVDDLQICATPKKNCCAERKFTAIIKSSSNDAGVTPQQTDQTDKLCSNCVIVSNQPNKNASYFRSLDDVRNDCLNYRKSLNQFSLSFDNVSNNSDTDDLGSVELVIISDEFINKSTDQNVTLLKPKVASNRSKKINGKSSTKQNAIAAAVAVSAVAATKSSHKKLIVISEEFKRKSLENTVVIVNDDDLKRELPALTKSRQQTLKQMKNLHNESIESFADDVQNKIKSFAFKSYDEDDGHLEKKIIESSDL